MGTGERGTALCNSPPLPEVGTGHFNTAWVAEPSPVAPCQTGLVLVFLESHREVMVGSPGAEAGRGG